jgi:hypothetical protein
MVKASADIHKVAGLAVASVVCFFLQAFVVLFFDNPLCRGLPVYQLPGKINIFCIDFLHIRLG